MTHRKGAIWTERLLLGLILVSLAATLNLLLAIQRQAPAEKHASTEDIVVPVVAEPHERSAAPESEPAALEAPVVAEEPAPQPAPPPPVEDPTKKAIASLASRNRKRDQSRRGRRSAGERARKGLSVGRRRVGSLETARDARSPADRRHHGRGRETGA